MQVETLRFETESSVQVNTLPAPLLRRDAYIHELQTAIRECNANLDLLGTMENLTTQNAVSTVSLQISPFSILFFKLLLEKITNRSSFELIKTITICSYFKEHL